MKLNNKGFAVSAILYSFLLAFILFMLVVLATFNHSADIISAANDDIVNGNKFVANQIKTPSTCNEGKTWYASDVDKKILIKTSHGSYYWPKDFAINNNNNNNTSWNSTKGSGEVINIVFTKGSKMSCDDDIDNPTNVIDSSSISNPSPDFYCARITNSLTDDKINLHLVNVCSQ